MLTWMLDLPFPSQGGRALVTLHLSLTFYPNESRNARCFEIISNVSQMNDLCLISTNSAEFPWDFRKQYTPFNLLS